MAVLNKTANTFDVQGTSVGRITFSMTFDWIVVGP
jgi:hypothetical protein